MGEIGSYVVTAVISVAVTVVAGWLLIRLKPKGNVVWYSPDPFILRNPENKKTIYTQIIYIKNTGEETASLVEITHLRKPDLFSIIPSRKYEAATASNGEHTIMLENLGSDESFTIQLLDYSEPPSLPLIRSSSGLAEQRKRLSF